MTQLRRAGLLAAMLVSLVPVAAVPAHAQEAAKPAQAYSVQTTQVSVLLDDPEAAAILQRLIPTVYANELFQTMGRSQTLAAIQQYEPAVLTDAKLAEIQAAFDQLAQARSQ